VAAENVAGLTYVNSIAVARQFGLYSTRRYVHQHHRITLMTKGPLDSPQRTFHCPPEMPLGRAGQIYAVDVWTDVPEERRPGLLRYDNALSPALVSRMVRSTTDVGDLVADPFLGSGTTAVVCLTERRRFYGGDLNPNALRFAMARILAEVAPILRPDTEQLALFDVTGRGVGVNADVADAVRCRNVASYGLPAERAAELLAFLRERGLTAWPPPPPTVDKRRRRWAAHVAQYGLGPNRVDTR